MKSNRAGRRGALPLDPTKGGAFGIHLMVSKGPRRVEGKALAL